jgi:hypothetical protein
MAESPFKRISKKLPEIVAGGLLGDLFNAMFGIPTWSGVVVGALILGISRLAGIPILIGITASLIALFLIAFIVDCILDWTGKIRAVKIIFYDSDGKHIQKAPTVYYNEQSGQVVYEIKGYARIVNLGLYSRTLESVHIELHAGSEILDSRLLSQFPLEQRLLSLESTKLVAISSQLRASPYSLTQKIGADHSKVKINIEVRATGTFYHKTTRVLFKFEKKRE